MQLNPAPLVLAAQRGRLETVEALLAAGLSPDATHVGSTALIRAARAGHESVVAALLRAGADPDVPDPWNETALDIARLAGHEDIAHLLEQVGAVSGDAVETDPSMDADLLALMGAAEPGLLEAAREGHVRKLRELIDGGADVDERNSQATPTPLMAAAEQGQLETVRLLLDAGADVMPVDSAGRNARQLAADPDIADLLAAAGAPDAPHLRLIGAAERGDIEALTELLIQVKANAVDAQGRTALMAAAAAGRVQAVETLLNAGADESLTDLTGMSALHYVAWQTPETGHRVVDRLLQAGADPNQADDSGYTPLMAAAATDAAAIVARLLQAGADVGAVNAQDATALDGTSDSGVRELLLAAGATETEETTIEEIFVEEVVDLEPDDVVAFADLAGLSHGGARLLIRACYDELAVALLEAPQAVADRLLSDLPVRRRARLLEEQQFLGPVSAGQVEAARERVLAALADFEAEGSRMWAEEGGGDEEEVEKLEAQIEAIRTRRLADMNSGEIDALLVACAELASLRGRRVFEGYSFADPQLGLLLGRCVLSDDLVAESVTLTRWADSLTRELGVKLTKVSEGVLAIQQGWPPRVLKDKLKHIR